MLNPPARFYYFLATAAALVLLGQVGQAIQFPSKRVPNLFLALLTLVAGGIHVFKYLPLLKTFVPRYVRPDDEATALYLIAFWNAVTLGLLVLSTLVSIGMEEAAEEQASRLKKKRSVHAESKTE